MTALASVGVGYGMPAICMCCIIATVCLLVVIKFLLGREKAPHQVVQG